jgi:hypothetical protein
MVRKPPQRKTRGPAVISSVISVKKRKQPVRETSSHDLVTTEIPPGPASVSVTHGMKFWASDQSSGMTIESTSSVTIPCDSDLVSLERANDTASELAHKFMTHNAVKVRRDLDAYLNGDE